MIEELAAARRSAGWSQSALADRIGVDVQTVKRLEKGIGSVPTLVTAMATLNFHLTGLGPGSTLADQLRTRRHRKSLSLAKAAERAGLARATVSNLESGGGSITSLLRLLAVLAPRARRKAPERSYWGQAAKLDRDSRFTPVAFMESVYAAFGEVDLDPCAHLLSPVVARRRILLNDGGDGLVDTWSGKLAYVNPPFSDLLKWLRRAHAEWVAGHVATVVCLVPVRTDSAWFHDELSPVADIFLLRGRIRFLDSSGNAQPTPFSLMMVTLGATDEQKMRFDDLVDGFWLARSSPAPQTPQQITT